MAEYCHNSCSMCPPFARIHAWRCPCHSSIALSMTVWSMPCQTCRKDYSTSVHNICSDKIVCYLQRIFNKNRKLKQQVSKLSALKLGVHMFKNQNMLHNRLHFLLDKTSKFHKVVWQHTEGMVVSNKRVLLEIYLAFQQWKNFENPLRIDKVIAMTLVYYFFWNTV